MKKTIIALLLILALIVPTINTAFAETRLKVAVVLIVDRDSDIVLLKDYNGKSYRMKGCEDWDPLDLAILTLDNGKIKSARYQGNLIGYYERFGR